MSKNYTQEQINSLGITKLKELVSVVQSFEMNKDIDQTVLSPSFVESRLGLLQDVQQQQQQQKSNKTGKKQINRRKKSKKEEGVAVDFSATGEL